jgi:hypothetical protein
MAFFYVRNLVWRFFLIAELSGFCWGFGGVGISM